MEIELKSSTKGGEIFVLLSNCLLVKKDCILWS